MGMKKTILEIYCSTVQRKIVILKVQLSEQIIYVENNRTNQPKGEHFNEEGHTLINFKILILEKATKKGMLYRREREQ